MANTTRFDRAVAYVIANEVDRKRVESNDQDDAGGRTRWGITEAVAQRHGCDIRKLTKTQAIEIYRKDYWLAGLDRIANEAIAIKAFDFGVNAGTHTSIRFLQRTANEFGARLAVDGVLGRKTVEAINKVDANQLIVRFAWMTIHEHYTAIVARKPSQAKFLDGWRNRMSLVPMTKQEQMEDEITSGL